MGLPLTAIARDQSGHLVRVESTLPLVEARTQPLTHERLQEQLGRLGNTPFKLEKLVNHLQGGVLLPISELNRLRREIVSQLETLRAQPPRWQLRSAASLSDLLPTPGATPNPAPLPSPQLLVLVRNLDQLHAALQSGIETLYCEFEDPRAYREAVSLVKEGRGQKAEGRGQKAEGEGDGGDGEGGEGGEDAGMRGHGDTGTRQSAIPNLQSAIPTPHTPHPTPSPAIQNSKLKTQNSSPTLHTPHPTPSIWVAPPRITKPGETWILQQVRACDADGYLVRNYDQLQFFAGDRCIGDFSLNVANPLSADFFKQQFGLERLTASYDLNIHQLGDLLGSCPPEWFEVTIHQHMPMFHMEHCVFCAFLSDGTDYTNCGRPCENHRVKLRDRVGAEHSLKADAGCRNTLFNGTAQTGAEYAQPLLNLGLRHFRIEFVDETPEQVRQTIQKYQKLLGGEITGSQLWRELKLQNQLGVTRGPMIANTHN
nr:DUF3656 domain-containing protein [Kovacikia minuta]